MNKQHSTSHALLTMKDYPESRRGSVRFRTYEHVSSLPERRARPRHMCDGVQTKLRRAAEIVDIILADRTTQTPSIVRTRSNWLALTMRLYSVLRHVRQRTDCQMITAHSFTLFALSLGDGVLNNWHNPAAVLRHVLQVRDLRARIIDGGSCRPRGCKPVAFDTRPKLFDTTGDSHDSDTQQTFRQDSSTSRANTRIGPRVTRTRRAEQRWRPRRG